VRIAALTNGSNADSRRVRAGLDLFDARMLKLDAGNERVFKAINGPLARTTLTKIIANARRLRDVTIQSLFVGGEINNSQPSDIEDWIEAVALVKPREVHIVGLARPPAYSGFERLDEDALYVIASKLERRTQIKAQVFP
jgi:wyosine [tRNA(Phe)-imidazoG37] synthetase (radical SAM superfamily)